MNVDLAVVAYFSPTNTTKIILETIYESMGIQKAEVLDLTRVDVVNQINSDIKSGKIQKEDNQIVILGAPVYSGRIPQEAVNRFKLLKGNNRPAVVVVVYGNRAYEDALLELKDLALEIGFKPVGAGAFIGEHSFSNKETPIAVGRPDESDREKAREFGKSVINKLGSVEHFADLDKIAEQLKIPGNFPYKERTSAPPISPVTMEDICIKCGLCVEVCPTQAITLGEIITTNAQACLRCCACIKNCPTDARIMDHPKMIEIAQWLNSNCSTRKEPEFYY